MTYMLDTNICIYLMKGMYPELQKRVADHLPDGVVLSVITVAELCYGVEHSMWPEKNRNALLRFLSPFHVRDFGMREAACYGAVRAKLAKNGTPIGTMDTLIAAHALSCRDVLITRNIREFARVDGLVSENWVDD